MTALARPPVRDADADFADTNRLRTVGTDHLLAAVQAAGGVVAQSFTGGTSPRTGSWVKDETDGGP